MSQQICDVSGLGHLSHLRVLNLAGNEITVVSGLFELKSLTELNLRRNRVRQVVSTKYVCSCMKVGGVGTESEVDGMTAINGFLLKSGGSELCGMLLFSLVLDVLDVFSEELCHKRKLGRNYFSCVCLTCDALFVFYLQFDLDQLPCLQRLFLSHNLIHEYDISSSMLSLCS